MCARACACVHVCVCVFVCACVRVRSPADVRVESLRLHSVVVDQVQRRVALNGDEGKAVQCKLSHVCEGAKFV